MVYKENEVRQKAEELIKLIEQYGEKKKSIG